MDAFAPQQASDIREVSPESASRFVVPQESASLVPEQSLASSELRSLYESTQIAAVLLDGSMRIRAYTPAATTIFHLTPGDRGRPLREIAYRLSDIDLPADVRRVLEERKAFERPVRMQDGKIVYLMRIAPCRIADAEEGVSIAFVNVSSVVAVEEQQRILVAELNHRVRNMLQVVIGLANQTVHRSEDLQQFSKAFFGRMQALGRAYELLSRDGWQKVPIGELVRTQLAPFASEGNRYESRGEPCVLTANAALSLGLVLYELATNATKYGALSVPAGRVEIEWQLVGAEDARREFILRWKEIGGPVVKPPTRQGFGSELVQRQLKYELNGTAEMAFNEDGLTVTLAVPAEEAVETVAGQRGGW